MCSADSIIEIDKLSSKGHGVGRIGSRNVEILYGLPGERYKAQLSRRKRKGLYKALSQERIDTSPNRVVPKCIHFGECGGCTWQHVPYPVQLKFKQELIEKLFKPFTTMIKDIIPSQKEWAYRNKMEFSFSEDRHQKRYLGLCIPASRGKVVHLTECHLVDPWMLNVLEAIGLWWEQNQLPSYNFRTGEGLLGSVTVRKATRTEDSCLLFHVLKSGMHLLTTDIQENLLEILAQKEVLPKSIHLELKDAQKGKPTTYSYQKLYGEETFKESLLFHEKLPLHLSVSPSSFLQPNTRQAEIFYQKSLALAGDLKGKLVFDLYCGAAPLGMLAAREAEHVYAIESHPKAFEDVKRSLLLNNVTNLTFLLGRVEDFFPKLVAEHGVSPHLVIVDPPRQGLGDKVVQQITSQHPEKILYISCNPKTQAIDTEMLLQEGYVIEVVQPVDQFPQTPHLENIILFTRP